ncbi:cobyric acid synthase CobQ, partial [Staphylococcus sp. SIMBA_130]
RVIGTYLHHLFHNDEWRTVWLNGLRSKKGLPEQKQINRKQLKEKTYDDLANELKPYLNWELIKSLMFQGEHR